MGTVRRPWHSLVAASLFVAMILGLVSVGPWQIGVAKADYAQNLLFSEYLKGTSNNKAVEIFNGTDHDINAANYAVVLYSNGTTTPTATMLLTGTIPSGGTLVLANTSADPAIIAQVKSSSVSMTGDDALVLKDNLGNILDSIGQVGFRPGTGGTGFWGVAGGVNTAGHMVRASSVKSGDTNSTDLYDPIPDGWVFAIQSDYTTLGSHTMDNFGPVAGTPTISGQQPAEGSTVVSYSPAISANVNWGSSAGPSNVSVIVDGQPATASFGAPDPISSISQVTVSLASPLSSGAHTVLLTATNDHSNTATSTWNFTVANMPGAPTLVGSVGDASATLNWTDAPGSLSVTGWNLYRSTSQSGPFTLLNSLPLTSASYADTGLTNGATYWYQVTAINGLGEGQPSTAVSLLPTSGDVTPPVLGNLTPAAGQTEVDPATLTIIAPFTEPVFLPGSPPAASGAIAGVSVTAGGAPVSGVTANLANDVITITLPAPASINTVYQVNIPAGVVQDANGVGNAAISWSFTTKPDYITIAAARAQQTGQVIIQGIVTAVFGSEMYVQDATAGIVAFKSGTGFKEADKVKVTGSLKNFNTLLEIDPVATFAKIATDVVPTPLETTANLVSESLEGQLITIKGLTLSGLPANPTTSGYTVNGTDGVGQAIQIRIDRNAAINTNFLSNYANGNVVDLTGVVSAFNGIYQIKPRRNSDMPKLVMAPVINHTQPTQADWNVSFTLSATITANTAVSQAYLFYRSDSGSAFKQIAMTAGPSQTFSAVIPATDMTGTTLEYYFTAVVDATHTTRLPSGSGTFTLPISLNDIVAPTITVVSPGANGFTGNHLPQVSATFADNASGIDVATVLLSVDGTDVTPLATVTASGLTYTPAVSLNAGVHTVAISLKDIAGNLTSQTWSFTVADPQPGQNLLLISDLLPDSNTTGQADEFIHIFNPTASLVSLDGLSLTTVSEVGVTATETFPIGYTINPGQWVVVAKSAAMYKQQDDPYASAVATFEYGSASSNFGLRMVHNTTASLDLSDVSNAVVLKDIAGNEIDVVRYANCTFTMGSGPTCAKVAPYTGTGWNGAVIPWPQTAGYSTNNVVLTRAIDEATIGITAGSYKPDTNRADDWLTTATDSRTGLPYWQAGGPGPFSTRFYSVGQMLSMPNPTWTFTGAVTTFVAPDTSYQAVKELFDNATSTIDLNMYEFTLEPLADSLIAAKSRGVAVRVLLEGQPCCDFTLSDQQRYIAKKMKDAGIDVRILLGATDRPRRYTNVDHAKYAVVDLTTVNPQLLVFSGNFKPSNTSIYPGAGNRDWGIIINNTEAAQYYTTIFNYDADLNRRDVMVFSFAPAAGFVPSTATTVDPSGTYMHPFSTHTINGTFSVTPVNVPEADLLNNKSLLGMLKSAQTSILLEYATLNKFWGSSVTGASLTATPMPVVVELLNAARRGVKVRVLLDGKYSDPADDKSNASTVAYLNQVAQQEGLDIQARIMPFTILAGVLNSPDYLIREFPGYNEIHNKGIIVDDRLSLVSSINGTQASFLRNREAAVIIENEQVASFYGDVFWYDWYDGVQAPEWPVISEVKYNEAVQYVELYNPTSADVNLSGWKLVTSTGQWAIPDNTVLQQGGVLTIVQDAAAFKMAYKQSPGVFGLTLSLGGTDFVQLVAPTGTVDLVAWNGGLQDWAVGASAGQNLIRVNACKDTNSWVDWSGTSATTGVVTCNGVATVAPTLLSSNADLGSLALSAGALTPAFASDVTVYTVAVPNEVTTFTVTPVAADLTSTVDSTVPATLVVGVNQVSITVTAEDGTTKEYKVEVNRSPSSNADLGSLAVSIGTLTPAFDPSVTSYTVNVGNAVTSVTLTGTVADSTASMVVAGDTQHLAVGNNPATVTVTAQDGTTVKVYTVTVNRAPSSNADLGSLSVSIGTLTPAFDPSITSYTVNVDNAVTSVTMTGTVIDSTASMVVAGDTQHLAVGSNPATVTVTAQDGSTVKVYTVTVNRAPSSNADLGSLAVSIGTLTPAFDPSVTSYTVNVDKHDTSVTLTAVAADSTATVVVTGDTMHLAYGNNTITVTVTAQNGTTVKVYTVTIVRPHDNGNHNGDGNNGEN